MPNKSNIDKCLPKAHSNSVMKKLSIIFSMSLLLIGFGLLMNPSKTEACFGLYCYSSYYYPSYGFGNSWYYDSYYYPSYPQYYGNNYGYGRYNSYNNYYNSYYNPNSNYYSSYYGGGLGYSGYRTSSYCPYGC